MQEGQWYDDAEGCTPLNVACTTPFKLARPDLDELSGKSGLGLNTDDKTEDGRHTGTADQYRRRSCRKPS